MAIDLQPSSREKKQPRSKPAFSAGHYFVLVALVGAGLLVMTDKVEPFVEYLYQPFSLVILVVIGSMYLMQKGSDRSRVYRLELLAMHRRRVEDIQLHRDVASQLEKASDKTREALDESPENAAEKLNAANAGLEKAIEQLRDRS